MSVTLGDILSTRLPLDLKATSTSSRTPTALSCFLVRSHSYNPTRSKQKTPGLAVSHDKRFLSKILQAAKSQLDPDVRMDEGLPADGRLKWAGFSGWRRPLRILAGFLYGYEVGESGEGLVIGDELGLQSHLLNYVYGLVGFVLKSRTKNGQPGYIKDPKVADAFNDYRWSRATAPNAFINSNNWNMAVLKFQQSYGLFPPKTSKLLRTPDSPTLGGIPDSIFAKYSINTSRWIRVLFATEEKLPSVITQKNTVTAFKTIDRLGARRKPVIISLGIREDAEPGVEDLFKSPFTKPWESLLIQIFLSFDVHHVLCTTGAISFIAYRKEGDGRILLSDPVYHALPDAPTLQQITAGLALYLVSEEVAAQEKQKEEKQTA